MGLDHHHWTPRTIQKALRLAAEVPSFQGAVEQLEELTHLAMGKSTLNDLVAEYGGRLAAREEAEAQALGAGEGLGEAPVPDAETMAVSLDGVMVHLRGEGWKEAKVAAFSAVVVAPGEVGEGPQVTLERHSYRAGLWEAPRFAQMQWAEAWQRGLTRAKRVVAVADGAAWIWHILRDHYAPCIEVIDWWHALQRLWVIAWAVCGQGTPEAAVWVRALEEALWAGRVREVVHALRERWARGRALSEEVRHALGYLHRHRRRMRYGEFRAAGLPVGSGTVESACKVVVHERACQAGMRWSRPRLQAMLALRCALLSGRWDTTWSSLTAAGVA